MATAPEVESAVRRLVSLLAAVDQEVRARVSVDRSVSCHVTDLDVVWSGRLCDDGLVDLTDADSDKAQLRLSIASDDLVALVEGRLSAAAAWATGRLKVQASPLDLLKLRALL